MNKLIGLIVAAVIITVIGLSTTLIGSKALTGTSQDIKKGKKKTVCNYQVKQYRKGNLKASELNDECLSYIQQSNLNNQQTNNLIIQQTNIPVTN